MPLDSIRKLFRLGSGKSSSVRVVENDADSTWTENGKDYYEYSTSGSVTFEIQQDNYPYYNYNRNKVKTLGNTSDGSQVLDFIAAGGGAGGTNGSGSGGGGGGGAGGVAGSLSDIPAPQRQDQLRILKDNYIVGNTFDTSGQGSKVNNPYNPDLKFNITMPITIGTSGNSNTDGSDTSSNLPAPWINYLNSPDVRVINAPGGGTGAGNPGGSGGGNRGWTAPGAAGNGVAGFGNPGGDAGVNPAGRGGAGGGFLGSGQPGPLGAVGGDGIQIALNSTTYTFGGGGGAGGRNAFRIPNNNSQDQTRYPAWASSLGGVGGGDGQLDGVPGGPAPSTNSFGGGGAGGFGSNSGGAGSDGGFIFSHEE